MFIPPASASPAGRVKKTGDTMSGNLLIGDDHALNVDGSAVFNETGADADFRVEGDTDANVLFVDAGNNRVGIGTNTPDEKGEVVGNFKISDATTPTKSYRFRTNGGALDLEAGGQSLYFSIWANADYTGNQYQQFRMQSDGGFMLFERGVVFNENASADQDLRVKGDTDDQTLFVDVSANSVGLGTADPTAKLDINSDVLRLRTAKTPATAGATGNRGDICTDADYIYVCTAANTWKRAALSTW